MELLNVDHTWVRNPIIFQFLQPLVSDIGPTRDVLPPHVTGSQESKSSFQKRFGHASMIGNILPASQWVELYLSETHYPRTSLAYEHMQEDEDNQPFKILASNITRLKKEQSLANAQISTAAKRRGHRISAKTISNIETSAHKETIKRITAAAVGLGVETWQLFVRNLPDEPRKRRELSELVRAFLLLEDEHNRQLLLGPLTALLMNEGKIEQFHKDIAKRGRTDRDENRIEQNPTAPFNRDTTRKERLLKGAP